MRSRRALLFLALWGGVSAVSPGLPAVPPQGVAPEERLEDLFAQKGPRAASAREEGGPGFAWRLVSWVALLCAGGAGGLLLLRRLGLRARPLGGGGLEVVASAALSPRHTVHLLRIGSRLVAVGVAGDRMTVLLETAYSDLSSKGPGAAEAPDRGQEARGVHAGPGRDGGGRGRDEPASDGLLRALGGARAVPAGTGS